MCAHACYGVQKETRGQTRVSPYFNNVSLWFWRTIAWLSSKHLHTLSHLVDLQVEHPSFFYKAECGDTCMCSYHSRDSVLLLSTEWNCSPLAWTSWLEGYLSYYLTYTFLIKIVSFRSNFWLSKGWQKVRGRSLGQESACCASVNTGIHIPSTMLKLMQTGKSMNLTGRQTSQSDLQVHWESLSQKRRWGEIREDSTEINSVLYTWSYGRHMYSYVHTFTHLHTQAWLVAHARNLNTEDVESR